MKDNVIDFIGILNFLQSLCMAQIRSNLSGKQASVK